MQFGFIRRYEARVAIVSFQGSFLVSLVIAACDSEERVLFGKLAFKVIPDIKPRAPRPRKPSPQHGEHAGTGPDKQNSGSEAGPESLGNREPIPAPGRERPKRQGWEVGSVRPLSWQRWGMEQAWFNVDGDPPFLWAAAGRAGGWCRVLGRAE